MPFCPSCRYEYKIGVTVCPDCNEKLVDRLPEKPKPEESPPGKTYEDWVPLVRVSSPGAAEMTVEGLRAKDIPAVIQSGVGHFGFAGTQGLSSFAPVGGGYSIMVPREFVDDAAREAEVILGDDWEKSKLVDIGK